MPENSTPVLEKRNLNLEDALEAMDALTISKICDLVYYIDQVLANFDGPHLERNKKQSLENLRFEANEFSEYLFNDLQTRSLEYEHELKKLTPQKPIPDNYGKRNPYRH
ncbi:MAG: hypothetical protein CL670_04860 [Balneola sp.]|jgi:hypothetical protein|nr:hypothetical protein [Balneola sp.]MBE78462.1 hypothetical protein [Balneola sp.]HBX66620.1 hypothetical protein [Balneolaceae bacterium]|tara:strand:- start:7547 stop:7873 length:327 start_codon:yes stop_codon:yes gene_type:complete